MVKGGFYWQKWRKPFVKIYKTKIAIYRTNLAKGKLNLRLDNGGDWWYNKDAHWQRCSRLIKKQLFRVKSIGWFYGNSHPKAGTEKKTDAHSENWVKIKAQICRRSATIAICVRKKWSEVEVASLYFS